MINFEDIVSEIGILRSFVNLHKSLYGKRLLFYYTDLDYHEDEPNIHDIQFLLWECILEDEYSEILVNPDNEALSYAARNVYAYFMELFERRLL